MEAAIDVKALSKTYVVPERSAGFKAAFKAVFHREKKEVHAVREINFRIQPGEVVGFLGPNGAGKTTSLKMLSGLLHPTSGQSRVLGFNPWFCVSARNWLFYQSAIASIVKPTSQTIKPMMAKSPNGTWRGWLPLWVGDGSDGALPDRRSFD